MKKLVAGTLIMFLSLSICQAQITSRLNEMAYGNGNFIAVGATQDYISTDGDNWEENAPDWQNWGITFGGGKFVKACGFGRIFSSETGQSNT